MPLRRRKLPFPTRRPVAVPWVNARTALLDVGWMSANRHAGFDALPVLVLPVRDL